MDAIPIELMRSLGYMNLDRLLADPVTQIAGYGLFFDMTGLTSRQLMHRRDKSIMKLETKVFQVSVLVFLPTDEPYPRMDIRFV